MASARLIPKALYHSRTFLKLPVTAQNLMTFLILDSDNDGIVEAYGVMRMIGAADDDLRVLVERGMVYVLDDEWITYIRNFQDYNKLDPRNFQVSKHRQLLLQVHPELKDKLITPKKREKSHGMPWDTTDSLGEGKRREEKGNESLSNSKQKPKNKIDVGSMMRANYDYASIENKMLGHNVT